MTITDDDGTTYTLTRLATDTVLPDRLHEDIREIEDAAPKADVRVETVTGDVGDVGDVGDDEPTDLGYLVTFETNGFPPLVMAWYQHTAPGLDINRTYHQGPSALSEALASLAGAESVNTAIHMFGGHS